MLRNQSGFTLIDVMIAGAIMSVMGLGMAGMLANAHAMLAPPRT